MRTIARFVCLPVRGVTDRVLRRDVQERMRGVNSLNPVEKLLLSLSNVVLRGRFSRNLFVLYALGLHFLLLSTLYNRTSGGTGVVATVPAPPVPHF